MKNIIYGTISMLLLLPLMVSASNILVQQSASQYYEVFLNIYSVGIVDAIENPWLLEDGADWTVKVLFYNGEVWDERTIAGPHNNDNPILEAIISWRVDLSMFQNVTFKIQLYERDGWGLLPPDVADISAFPGGGYDDYNGTFPRGATYVGYYNLISKTLSGDYTQFDGCYYRTSGNFDGSTDVDENDADLWFKIIDTYGRRVLRVPEDYATIQAAIDAAIPGAGEIIRVGPGLYNERITVYKSFVEIIGEPGAIIDGSSKTSPPATVFIIADHVKFCNFCVQGATNNKDQGGIAVHGNYTTITGNTIANNVVGIYLHTAHSYICWNLIKDNTDSATLAVSGCINNTIIGNNVLNNEGYGIYLYSWEGGSNLVQGNTIQNNSYCGICLEFSHNNFIQGNYIKDNPNEGITLLYSGHNILKENYMEGNRYNFGVRAHDLLEHFLQDIDTSNFVDGKPIYYWVNKTSGQIPSDAGYVGVINSANIEIKDLQIRNNLQGILFAFTTNSIIKNVSLVQNKWGIHFFFSNNNILYENTITNSSLRGLDLISANGNLIFHNNFVTNTIQVYAFQATNHWDNGYPSGGNYWSDYGGEDFNYGPYQNETGSDGIGDAPYLINTNNVDKYPLVCPWPSHDLAIINVTSSHYFVKRGDCLTVNVSLINQGDFAETFNLTVLANTTVIDTEMITNLPIRSPETFSVVWNTSGYARGNYTISAYVTPVPSETDYLDNSYLDGLVIVRVCDIVILNVTFSNQTPAVNETIFIYVTVKNRGDFSETFDVSVNYTRILDPLIGTQTVTLQPEEVKTLNFTWTTNTWGRHEIKAYTSQIPDDINPQDNTKIVYIYVSVVYTSASSANQNEWEEINARGGRLRYMAYTR